MCGKLPKILSLPAKVYTFGRVLCALAFWIFSFWVQRMHNLSDYLTCAKYKYLENICGNFYVIFLGSFDYLDTLPLHRLRSEGH